MKEGLSSEHGGELLSDTFVHLLDGGWVSEEGDAHLESLWWDIADGALDVVGDPLNEVWWVLVLYVKHLLIDFFGAHSASEEWAGGQVSSVSWVRCAHHVLGIEHLLSELWDGEGSVLLRSTRGEWCEADHEEVESWEWNQVNGEFSQVGVELSWESEAACDTGHGGWDEMVEVSICWGGELKGSEADIVKGFVIDDHDFIGVLDELMDGEGGVVWLNNGVRDFWGWEDREGLHDSVWVFLTDLWDEEGSHSWSSSSSKGVADLESL